jgi:uncharacterized membrane protein (UPF0127 family)
MPSRVSHLIPCTVAAQWPARVLGLMGKKPPFHPLFIPRCSGIHTCFLQVPLALVWLDPFSQVIRIDRNVLPWKTRMCKKAVSVVEFPDNAFPIDIRKKDVLSIFPITI